MTGSLESTEGWLVAWSPKKDDWQLGDHKKLMIAENKIWLAERTSRNFKSRRNTERDTTSTSNDNPGLPGKYWDCHEKLGLPEEQTEISEKSGLPEKSQGLAKPRSKPLSLVQQHWQKKNEGYHSKKWLIKGPVQSLNKKDLQSDAVYIHVFV